MDWPRVERSGKVKPVGAVPAIERRFVMPRKYAIQYVDRLLTGNNYSDLVELSSVLCSSPTFTLEAPDYGLPPFAFTFVETLPWFALSVRSGVCTYYEATPTSRQQAMASALKELAPDGFADWYERGMSDWRDEQRVRAVDDWIESTQSAAEAWLHHLARSNRDAVLAMT